MSHNFRNTHARSEGGGSAINEHSRLTEGDETRILHSSSSEIRDGNDVHLRGGENKGKSSLEIVQVLGSFGEGKGGKRKLRLTSDKSAELLRGELSKCSFSRMQLTKGESNQVGRISIRVLREGSILEAIIGGLSIDRLIHEDITISVGLSIETKDIVSTVERLIEAREDAASIVGLELSGQKRLGSSIVIGVVGAIQTFGTIGDSTSPFKTEDKLTFRNVAREGEKNVFPVLVVGDSLSVPSRGSADIKHSSSDSQTTTMKDQTAHCTCCCEVDRHVSSKGSSGIRIRQIQSDIVGDRIRSRDIGRKSTIGPIKVADDHSLLNCLHGIQEPPGAS